MPAVPQKSAAATPPWRRKSTASQTVDSPVVPAAAATAAAATAAAATATAAGPSATAAATAAAADDGPGDRNHRATRLLLQAWAAQMGLSV